MKTNTNNTTANNFMENHKIMVDFFDVKNDHFDLRMVANAMGGAAKDLCDTPAYNKTMVGAPYVLEGHRVFNSHTDCGYLVEWQYGGDYMQIEWREKPFDTANSENEISQGNFCYRRVERLWYHTWEDSQIDFEDYCTNTPDYEVNYRLQGMDKVWVCGDEYLYSPRYEDFYIFRSENGVRVYCSDYGIVYHKWSDKGGVQAH